MARRGARALGRHRASIGAHFDCTPARHVCLARQLVEDDGFRGHYDGLAPGLAMWLRAAVEANARSRGADPSHGHVGLRPAVDAGYAPPDLAARHIATRSPTS
ncbi:TipAS antibiotic-recognition domain-containing protein [Cellulosimicrobium cellulans]|uniref:TipAS antibiotic-recognition domain-containing protein n=1 Tax=Cellulosimicrobium cellulans TaxID=1710 RepID=UPI0036E9CF2D